MNRRRHKQNVRVTVHANRWGAVRDGNLLTFWHAEGNPPQKTPIKGILPGKDTTGEQTSYTAVAANLGGIFQFGLDGNQLAAGSDGEGNPSLVTVATSAGAASLAIQPGDSAENLIQGLVAQLQAGGVLVTLTSPTSFMILGLDSKRRVYVLSGHRCCHPGAGRRRGHRLTLKGTTQDIHDVRHEVVAVAVSRCSATRHLPFYGFLHIPRKGMAGKKLPKT